MGIDKHSAVYSLQATIKEWGDARRSTGRLLQPTETTIPKTIVTRVPSCRDRLSQGTDKL